MPILAVLPITLFFNPAFATAQKVYTIAVSGHTADAEGSEVAGVIDQLQHNALLALLGAILLMGIVYVCHVSKACADLNRSKTNVRHSFPVLLILAATLSTFCSSCSVEQQVMAEQYRAAMEVEYRGCPAHHYSGNDSNVAFDNHSSSNGHSNAFGPSFCKYCGQRIPFRRY